MFMTNGLTWIRTDSIKTIFYIKNIEMRFLEENLCNVSWIRNIYLVYVCFVLAIIKFALSVIEFVLGRCELDFPRISAYVPAGKLSIFCHRQLLVDKDTIGEKCTNYCRKNFTR